MRIMLVQYAGNYLDAHDRLSRGDGETYHGHRYVLEQLDLFQKSFGQTSVLCCLSPTKYRRRLPSGVELMGAAAHPIRQARLVKRVIEEWEPTHLVIQGPLTSLINWGIKEDKRVVVVLANSFDRAAVVLRVKYGRLPRLLNSDAVDWVANHGVNACRSTIRYGVAAGKVIPWDWTHTRHPGDSPVKQLGGDRKLVYVGLVQENKGVGDLIRAISILKSQGWEIPVEVAGPGGVERFRRLARSLGVAHLVRFLGLVDNDAAFSLMRSATAVVIPSRHAYPEGLPLTVYEALSARTPIIASDHPMFNGHLVHGESAMVFPEKDANMLAGRIRELVESPALYENISRDSKATWERMQNPVKWGDLIYNWVADGDENRAWLAQRTIGRLVSDVDGLRISGPPSS